MKRSKKKWQDPTRMRLPLDMTVEPGYLLEHPLDDPPVTPAPLAHEADLYRGRSIGFAQDVGRAQTRRGTCRRNPKRSVHSEGNGQ